MHIFLWQKKRENFQRRFNPLSTWKKGTHWTHKKVFKIIFSLSSHVPLYQNTDLCWKPVQVWTQSFLSWPQMWNCSPCSNHWLQLNFWRLRSSSYLLMVKFWVFVPLQVSDETLGAVESDWPTAGVNDHLLRLHLLVFRVLFNPTPLLPSLPGTASIYQCLCGRVGGGVGGGGGEGGTYMYCISVSWCNVSTGEVM